MKPSRYQYPTLRHYLFSFHKRLLNIVPCCLIVLAFAMPASANQIYVYIDEKGNRVYSDRPPAKVNAEVHQVTALVTDAWTPVDFETPPKIQTQKLTQGQKATLEKHKRCENQKKQIDKLEAKLRHRLSPEEFDETKKTLSDLKWQHRRQC